MTTRIETPQSRCRVGFARADITPPVGIYHRMWGAALHDRASGVHRPLTATALWLESFDGSEGRLILGLDHCLLDPEEFERIRRSAGSAARISSDAVHVAMSHTHGSAWMSRSRSHLPGGDLIGPYLDEMADKCGRIAKEAAASACSATIIYASGRCSLAAHRNFRDPMTKQIVCGFNPDGPADDAVTVAKAVGDDGRTLGTIVNYACHPTTLAWENTLISPDYVGAMREVIEGQFSGPCLFLQGASADLGPREGYVGDPAVADRNGRQLGFAALSAFESMPPPSTMFAYAGAVVSGAILGSWRHERATDQFTANAKTFRTLNARVPLQYRMELPTEAETRSELAKWEAQEATARAASDLGRVSECRARCEQMTRQLARLAALPPGNAYPLPISVLRVGDALWVFTAGELDQVFQRSLRERFAPLAVIVATITNDWQPGYIPSAATYGYGIYQESISAVAPGSLESLIESVTRHIEAMIER